MSQYLQQTQREFKGQYKYSVDCDKIKTDPTALQVLDGSVRAKHTMIINAVVKENSGRIVVKIGKSNDIVKQEYEVAIKLEKLEGFIKMHCLFSCYNTMLTFQILMIQSISIILKFVNQTKLR